MRRRLIRVSVAAAAATVALGLVLDFDSSRRGLALSAYLAFLTALAVVWAAAAIATSRPVDRSLLSARQRRRTKTEPAKLPQLRQIESRVSRAYGSADGVATHFRPLLVQVVSAELARKHGVVLERRPDRARALLGDHLFEFVSGEGAPGPPAGLAVVELRRLIEEVESI